MSKSVEQEIKVKFEIFRGTQGRPCELMTYEEPSEAVAEAALRVAAAGPEQGHDLKVLFDAPGFSLARAWFKSEYPLPRHSHNVDCLYYITGGSLRIGTEVLSAGDGFFVGADVPYTYTPGPEGVEILEFRASNSFDIKVLVNNPAFFDRAVETVTTRQDVWKKEVAPPVAVKA